MKKKQVININKKDILDEYNRRGVGNLAKIVDPSFEMSSFHETYYKLLSEFARKRIRRLIVSVPPQHGKSMGASNILPAFLLGLNPDLKIVIGSYSFSLARRFGQGIQRIIEEPTYQELFPSTALKGTNKRQPESALAQRTSDSFDIVGQKGGVRLVGRECSLTGHRVDIMIMDDLYKDAMEANSPTIRENVWQWYTTVARTRMHNDSQELIVFTRWHEDDLIGRISKSEQVVKISSFDEIATLPERAWVYINFEAIKETPPTDIDPRLKGEALWPERHSAALLNERKALDVKAFNALYQGNPKSAEGLLYGEFLTYDTLPTEITRRANFTDTADTGNDYLCSINYCTSTDGLIYLTDITYSQAPMEHTEGMVAKMLVDGNISLAVIESNNGGRGFARSLERLIGAKNRIDIQCQHQRNSKEARILSNSTALQRLVRFPSDWKTRWGEFARDLSSFKRLFLANEHDDTADTLTAIVEFEAQPSNVGKIKRVSFFGN